jgi:dihydroxyacetone kinase
MVQPKKILNDPQNAVDEFISGLLLQYPNRLQKLQNHHVVLAAHPSPQQVQLLSGGGSGHEPSHAGWIGQGMLSGAVCGGIFASPSVAAVLAAIRAAASVVSVSALATNEQQQEQQQQPKSILLLVKNYTGDRLNFGMACEKANQEGIPCQILVVADDCALPRTKGITGARGVAGTVLIHKVAGAAAAKGYTLSQVAALATQVTKRMGTLGVALNNVTVPGAATVNDRLDDHTIEIGLGIHGEAGMKQSPLLTCDQMTKEMLSTIRAYGRTSLDHDHDHNHNNHNDPDTKIVPMFGKGDDLCLLVNNLGGTSNFEMSILANSAVKLLEGEYECKVSRLFVGAFMTSFDMHGVSLTVLNLTGASTEMVELLDAPTDAPAWKKCDIYNTDNDNKRASATERPEVVVDDDHDESKTNVSLLPPLNIDNFEATAKELAIKAAKALEDNEPLLTKYDTIVGDGDCGITMKRGATQVLERLEKGSIPTNHPVTMFAAMADAVSASMGGTSGVLLELMFRKMSYMLQRSQTNIGVKELCAAFQAGVDAISLYGGATVGSRTMLDALVPAAAVLMQTNDLLEAASKAKWGADGTAQMKTASAGRSNYLSEETLVGTPDPGAVAVSIVLEALSE